jgi:hypothetical protein
MTSASSAALGPSIVETPNEAEGPSAAELKAVKDAVLALAMAAKSFTFYPEGHLMAQNQIGALMLALRGVFEHTAELVLDIDREGLTYRGHHMYEPLPADDPLLPPLLRDGVQWIAFKKGVGEDQLAFFLRIINRFRVLMNEPEGDLVTELWQAGLPHIQYDAIEEFWEVQPRFDFSLFHVGPEDDDTPGEEDAGGGVEGEGPDGDSEGVAAGINEADDNQNQAVKAAVQIRQATQRWELMRLSAKEKESLKTQIEALEARDNTAKVRETLLFTLSQQKNEPEFNAFLGLLHDLLFDLLVHQQIISFHKLLRGIRRLQKKNRTTWQRELIHSFFLKISGADAWQGHIHLFTELHRLPAAEQQAAIQTINLLDPAFLLVLVPELSQIRGSALHQKLVVATAKLAARNIQVLERCLSGSDEGTLRQIAMVLGEMHCERSRGLLQRLGRHPSGLIRNTALKTLLALSTPSTQMLLHFLSDQHAGVRQTVLDHIGRSKDPDMEGALRRYIQHDPSVEEDEAHLIGCYRALGRCAREASLPFLEKVLLRCSAGDLLRFGGNAHRIGAAMALKHCRDEQAGQILTKAKKSLVPAIRNSYRKAMAS